ncbi:PTS sugar transporter subunit IIA [Luteococcus sp. OSA5]|uniref:PTS sugar transporter subunit IIA n=1 Tax=Luteococcus sp. OSA5 TaxID=3401630 RepID=UPI003B42EA76
MNLIDGSTVILQHETAPWQELVRLSAGMLERKGITTPDYVEGIFESIEKNGSYMLIAPRVLLAHTRPEKGAVGTGLSLITTGEDVPFGEEGKPTRLFFTLAASDSNAHLELLTHLAEVLADEALFEELVTTSDAARVQEILNP